MSNSREEQLADDMFERARAIAQEQSRTSGASLIEVDMEIEAKDERIAARVLEKRGVAQIHGNRVTIAVDLVPPWLRR